MIDFKQCYLKEMSDQGYSKNKVDAFHLKMIPHLLEINNVDKNARIIEVGVAEGHCILSAIKAGYTNAGAVDYVDINFNFFKENYGIDCYNVDITNEALPFKENSIGCYLFFHTIEHIESASLILREFLRTLKPGGKAFIVTPDWKKRMKNFYSDPTHIKPYNKEGLVRLSRIIGWEKIMVSSFGCAFGLGRLNAFKYFPKLGMIGEDILLTLTK